MDRFLLLFFSALPFLPALPLGAGASPSLVRIGALVIGGVWVVRGLASGRVRVPVSPPFLFGALFLLWIALSLLWAPEKTFALRKALYFFSLAPLALVAATRTKHVRTRLLSAFAKGAVASAAVGAFFFLAQFIFGAEAVAEAVTAAIGPVLWGAGAAEAVASFPSFFVGREGGGVLLRAFLPFPNPHTAVLFWGMGLAVAVARARHEVDQATRRRWRGGAALLGLALLASFSRGAYAVLLVWGLVAAGLAVKKAGGIPLARVGKRVVAGGAAAALMLFLFPSFLSRLFATVDVLEGSAAARLSLWAESIRVFAGSLGLGVGLGNFAFAHDMFAAYRTPINAHSLYLEFLAEVGALGLVLFVAALGIALLGAWRVQRSALQDAVFLALLFFALHAVFETNIYYPANAAALMLFFGIAASSSVRDRISHRRPL